MKKTILIALLALALSACSWFHAYRPDVQQGNVLSPQKVAKLHTGMLKCQVKTLLGAPVLENTFDDNQLLYVYNFIPNYGTPVKRKLILTFNNQGQLIKIEK